MLFVFGRKTPVDTMLRLAGAENAVTAFEESKPLTSEAVVQAAPDVILIPARGLGSVGGVDGLLKVPGIAETPAARSRRIVTVDDLMLLGFGPRTGKAVLELAEKLHPEPANREVR
jgi:iron complex transport system substrate-binding protein